MNGRYERELALIERRLAELGIMGKITRSTVLRNLALKGWFEEELTKGAKTVIAVGDDHTLQRLITCAQNVPGKKVVLGFIPLGKENHLAPLLHIPMGKEACDLVARRLIRRCDVGKVNEYCFISSCTVRIQPGDTILADHQWTIGVPRPARLTLYNSGEFVIREQQHVAHVDDGLLEGVIAVPQSALALGASERSYFSATHVTFRRESDIYCTYDSEECFARELSITVVSQAVSLIVGSGV